MALDNYGKFVDAWRDADPEAVPSGRDPTTHGGIGEGGKLGTMGLMDYEIDALSERPERVEVRWGLRTPRPAPRTR